MPSHGRRAPFRLLMKAQRQRRSAGRLTEGRPGTPSIEEHRVPPVRKQRNGFLRFNVSGYITDVTQVVKMLFRWPLKTPESLL